LCVCCENGSLKRFNFHAKSAAKFGSKHPLTSGAHASDPFKHPSLVFPSFLSYPSFSFSCSLLARPFIVFPFLLLQLQPDD